VRLLANPIEYRKRLLSKPLRYSGPRNLKALGSENPRDVIPAMVMLAYAAAPVFAGNVLLPAKLIDSGFRGGRQFSHLSYVYSKLGYPMPMFNYITPSSPAYKMGAKMGGRIGAFLSPALHDVTWTGALGKTKTLAKGGASGARVGAKVGGRVGARLIPGLGWAMLAYDVYDISVNRSLWGFDL
jgi:hypothetical protein